MLARVGNAICYLILGLWCLGWLNIFGPEYTWWALIYHFGQGW